MTMKPFKKHYLLGMLMYYMSYWAMQLSDSHMHVDYGDDYAMDVDNVDNDVPSSSAIPPMAQTGRAITRPMSKYAVWQLVEK